MRKITLLALVALFSSLSYAQTPCSPVSPLDCSAVETALPVNLDFNSPIPNTILDQAGLGTGFTTVMEHSETRRGGDLAVSDPTLNGYEPSLLTLSGGNLQLLSQGGIAFRNPNFSGGSSNNNNQVNTLGVGMDDLSGVIVIKTRLNNIVTGGGSAQAGIWYGYDEDNFVKLDVNASNVELRVEVNGLSGNGTTGSDQVQSDVGAFGNDVELELVIDRGTLTAQAFYVVGTGSRTLLGSLPVPASYFTGRDINTSGGQDNMSFAGIFASHRNGAQFTASFDEFSVERPPALPFEAHVNFMSERLGNNNGAVIDAPTGYDKDFGQAFGTNQTASGNDYGWKSKATGTPLDASHLASGNVNGVGRNRLGNAYGSANDQAKLEGTLVHFQGDNIRGNDGTASWAGQPRGTELFWEMEIPNGTYDVTIGLGDDGADIDSRHSATVEGFTVVPAFVPSAGENRSATITVAVNDGLLTVGGDGGFNSKINYIDVVESSGIPVSESLTFNPDLMDVDLVAGTSGTFSNSLAGNGTAPIGLVIEDNVNPTDKNTTGSNDWLTLPAIVGIGELDFVMDATLLSEGDTRSNTIIATAQGLRPAELLVTLTVGAPSSTETQITNFELAEQTGPAAFGPNVIDIEVANGADLTQLAPTIAVSPGASVAPDSGVATDFSLGPVTYTVTAEDGITTLDWQVTVTEAAAVNQAPVVENQSFEVAEDVLVGTLVGSVTATDTDTTELTYTITAGNDSGAFAVASSTGEITTATELDFENLAQYVLTVEVSDGELSDTADLTITVTDVTETLPFAAFVNFQNSAVTPPSGYLADFGKGFGTSSVSIGSEEYAYGWKRLSDGLAVDVSEDAGGNSNGAGRNRLAGGYAGATDQEKLEGSLMHFQGDNVLDQTGGQPSWAGQPRGDELFWELEVPNGIYQVTLGLGDKDQNNVDSRHSATLEGYTIIPAFVPTPGQTLVETMIVEVTDGLLTMTGLGGFNSKITHIEVIESTDTPVNGALTFDPSILAETLETGSTGTMTSSLTGAGATVIGLAIEDNINIENKNNTGFNDWLTLPGTNSTGSFDFAIDASDLAEGDTRNNTIVATAKGFAPAMLNADLTVTGAPVDIPQLVIHEIMSNPNAVGDSLGEWFEIYNPGTEAVNINGWTIRDNDTNSHAIDAEGGELLIPPSAYVVLGNNADVATNGGKLIDYEYDGFQLANTADEIILVDNDDNEIDRVEYDETTFPNVEGASMALNAPTDDNNVGTNWSAAALVFGTGDLGTPGLSNDAKANESPSFTSANEVSVEENQAAVLDIEVADDQDTEGSGIAYALTGDTDDTLFEINSETGVLSFLSPPDFETPLDGDSDNVYNVQVSVTDSGGLIGTQTISITVINVDEEAPAFSFVDDFDTYGTGNLHEIAPAQWLKEKNTDPAIPVLSEGLTANTTHSLDFSNGGHAHDLIPLTDNPVDLVPGQPFYFGTYFKVTSVTNRVRTAIRIDDEVDGEQWVREQVAGDGAGGLIARIGLGNPGSDNGNVAVASDEVFQFVVRGEWDGETIISYSWTIEPKLALEETVWTDAGTHTVQGTPQIGRLFISSANVNDAQLGPVRLATDYSAVVTEEIDNAPVVEAQTFDIAEDAIIGTIVGTVAASDVDSSDLSYSITAGNDEGIFDIDSVIGQITTLNTLDFETVQQYILTIEVADETSTSSAEITINVDDTDEVLPCSPISTLPCNQIAGTLPLSLDFTSANGNLSESGFTMVLEPSSRLASDDALADTDVPGYAPSLISQDASGLTINSTKGIFYSQLPSQGSPNSTDTNSQMNALGTGIVAQSVVFNISTTLNNPDFSVSAGNSSQQAGIWYGLDEDHIIKLVVAKTGNTTRKIQLQVENMDETTPAAAYPELNTGNIASNTGDLSLRLELDPVNLTAKGYYSLDGGAEVLVTEGGVDNLSVPASYFAGTSYDADIPSETLNFTGIFTTHRRAAVDQSIAVLFKSFEVAEEQQPLALSFDVETLSFTGTVGETIAPKTVSVSASSGNPTFKLSDDPDAASWLILPEGTVTLPDNTLAFPLGDIEFGIQEGLPAATYSTTIFATDEPDSDYDNAELQINLEITEGGSPQTPRVVSVTPADGATDVAVNASISANDLFLPNMDTDGNSGVDNSTITNATVKLFKQGSATPVGASVNGTGGGDAINLVPDLPLETNTTYVFEIDGVLDLVGEPFELFTSTFTTGGGNTGPTTDLDNVSFARAGAVASGSKYSTLTIGPDGKLYGLVISGDIHRWTISADGTLADQETLSGWKSAYANRTSVGMVFDPTATAGNLIAYVSHNSGGLNGAPDWDGKISRISGASLETEELLVTDLPRSTKDHLTNSLTFKPGEPNVLYFNQGSNSAAGKPDGSWGNREESLLTAATLRLDLTKLPTALPLNVRTTRNQTAINNVDINSPVLDGLYNPYFVDAPLTLFATGIRNAYDLVWHSNGQLYVPTNGTAGGSNAPASVDGTRRPDGTFYDYSNPLYPIVPFSDGNNTQRDWLFRVDPNSSIGYYGHPNPFRGEYVLNRGDIDVNKSAYDGVQPDENYRGAAFDFELNKSPNGVIEYRSDAENGNLKGALLVVRYSGSSDIIALVPDGPNGDVATSKEGIPGFGGFQDPLDLIEDVSTGNIYVSDYGRSEIVLLKPSNEAAPTPRIVLNADAVIVDAVTNSTFTQEVLLSNLGNAALNNVDAQVSGADADQFVITNLPASVNAQNSGSFSVAFTPTSNGPKYAQLVITGTNAESVTTPLSGLGKNGLGGSNEPSLQWILDTQLGAGVVNVGDTNPATNLIDLPNGSTYNDNFGDEVAVQRFERAIDAPVTLELLSVYGPTANNPITAFGWYPSGDAASTSELFTIGNDPASNGQTLNAPINGATEFDPGTQSFGFYSRWPFFNNRQLYSEDALNTFDGAIPHHVRVYELPGEDNAYIIATEEHISGFDYQDIVVIARNVRPFSDNPPVACSPISTLDCDELEVALPFSLDFDGTEGGLANTGFTMVDDPSARIAADGPISNPNVPGYEPSRLSVSNGTLVINANNGIAFRTNGTGAAFSSDVNSQINTLGVGIDADANGNFSIATTIVNPYTDGSNNSEQGGIWFGLDEDNFVKFVTNVAGELELRKELNGISANVEGDQLTLAVAGLNSSTVGLRLYIDLSAETMTAFYTLNNGTEVQMGTMALPAEYISGNTAYDNLSFAGVFATKRRELTADVNYTFENFSIVSDNVVAFVPIRINYSLPEDIPPAGYLVDSGLGYGDRGDGNNYGWLTVDGTNPLNLSANARNRGIAGVDILRNTLMHMQYGDVGGSNGIATEGIWEIEVPNGSYNVTVGVGDPEAVGPNGTGSEHTINIEGVNAINAFVPTGNDGAATQFASATVNITVTDGRLTLDAQGGFNTKINSLEITQGGAIDQPFFANVSPANNAINVAINEFQITVDVVVPEGYELDDTTIAGNVNLYEIVNGSEVLVPSNSNDTGGGDAITLTPLNSLKAFTEYRFRLTSGIEANLFGDLNDRLPFVAFSSDFTTGDVDTLTPLDLTGVEFTKVQGGAALGEGTSNQRFTSLVVGPDGKLYGSTIGDFQSDGQIYRWDMAADGTLENLEILSPELQGAPHPETGSRNNGDRLIIGFAFDPAATADNLIAYITHSFASETSGPEWDGVISRLSGPNLNTVEDLIIHLPRSTKDHLTNSLTFGPDGAMYLNQGSNSAGGEPDGSWGFRPERLLAAAVLKLEVDKLPTTLPLSAYTTDDIPTINAAPAASLTMSDGTYNPYATNAPLTVFASGVRNAYDLVWHSNGWLYVPTNGTAGGSNTPGTANYPLARRIDGRNTVPFTPPTNGNETQKDWLFKTKGGSYHGHPNPYRGEFILNHGGAPYSGVPGQQEISHTDVAKYPDDLGPDPNYSEPAYDFEFNKSPNGVIEYQSDAFGGRLQGLLMVVRFSGQDDLLVMQPEANGNIGNVNGDVPGLGGFDDPLDVVEDPKTGNLYVSEYDRGGNNNTRITLLRANVPATQGPEIAAAPTELIFETTVNDEGDQTDTKTVEVTNEGNAVLNITSAAITGDFANQFNTVQPSGALAINPGESQVYEVTFAPDLDSTDLGYQEAALTLASDATDNPSFSVGLHALKKAGFEGGQEPALQDVVDALGIGIDVGWTSLGSTTEPITQGDEVQVQRWIKATDAPINVTPVGRYSPAEELPFGWYTNDGDIETNEVGILAGGIENAQTLFPPIASGEASFDPQGAVFGFYVESNSFGRFNYTEDGINTGGVAHRTRVYPMADRDGNPIENSYLINFEDATNGDYQDYMFIIDNVIAFEDGILALEFDKGDLDFIASLAQETIPAQKVILTGNGGITTQEINLIASEEWLILPETYELGTAFDVNVDLVGLPIGSYQATITASAPFYTDAVIDINFEVTNELVYTYQFNFQTPDDIEISPEGYIDDIGAPYGEQSTILGDLTYGWVLPGTLTPAEAGVNGRNRDSGIQDGVLRQTFTIIGHPTPATYPQRDWVVNVPNGTYSVNISVGERDFTNSNHILDVNGTTVVDFDQENGNPDNLVYGEGTKFVDVTDGLLRLSLNPLGNNAKPNYIRLAPIDNSLLPPSITATFDGNQSGPDTYRGTVAISLEASDNSESGSIVRLEYALDGATVETYNQPILVGDIGARSLTVIAEDGNGNITERTFDFTLEAATGALLAIENMTKVPGTDRGFPANDYYTFHRLGNPGQAAVHDANVMRLNNTGTGDLVINDAIISDTDDYTYEVLDAAGTVTAFPITVPVGSYADLDITFIGTTGNGNNGIFVENIEIVSNADNALENSAVLHGAYSPQPEGGDEINAQEVFDAFGFQSSMLSIVNDQGNITPPNDIRFRPSSNFPDPINIDAGYEGDMILSDTFVQADPSKPVIGIQLSALHGGPGSNGARLVAVNGTGTVGGMSFSHDGAFYQTLLPKSGSNINFDTATTINEPFRIAVAGYLSSGGNNINGNRPDLLGLRIYKVIDHNGNIIPNEYIVLQDFVQGGCGAGSANCDWNDNTFYFINIRPEGVPTAEPAEAYLANVGEALELDIAQYFDGGYPGNSLTISASVANGSLPVWLTYNEVEGTLTGTPSNDATGSIDVIFDAVDTNGLTATTTLTVNINEAPVAVDDEITTTQNVAVLLDALLANDSEPNGQDVSILTVDSPLNGEAVLQEDGLSVLYTPNVDYVGSDSFTYTVADESGLTATANVSITVDPENQAPEALIVTNIDEGPAALFVEFTGSGSTDEIPSTLQFAWDFGDGLGTATDADTSYTFASAGQFTVSLTVTDEQGLSDVATALITVSAPPNTAPTAVADATPNAANPLQFTFDGSGSSDSESDLSYSWDFGDGSTSSEATPSHTYALAGTYDVSLTVTDEGELTDSATLQVIAEEPVTNDFALRINAGGPQVVHDGETFLADQNFAGGKVYVNASAQVPVLYQTERSASPPTFAYNIPLENGRYQLTLHFAEIYHGATGGGTGGTGKRVFDVSLEGNTVLNDFDINADVGPQTVVLKTFELTIADGVLNMTFDAAGGDGIDQPKLSAITILGLDDPVVACELPEEWTNSDIGAVAAEGDVCYEDGRYEVSASGADIWGSADEFHYVYQELEGDGEIIAQVLSLDPTNVWAKAGVMMRNDLDANSASAMMIIAPNPNSVGGQGYSFQHRSTKGSAMGTGNFTAPQLVPGGLPYYVRMVRSGNTFTGYVSATDGNWIQVGSQTIAMNGTIFVGLATTSHNDGTLTEAIYENVSVTETVVTNEAPTASFVASPTNGTAPLVVNFDSSASNDDKGIVSYAWDFGDGATSTDQNPQHTFSVGIYEVSLTVMDAEGESDVANVTITSEEPVVADFELRINAGGPQVVHNGETFSADQNFVGGKSYTNVNATVPVLYQTERSALPPNFGYEIPLVNGDYQVTLHFAEIFWSANGGRAGGNATRIFDVFMEGNNILNDYSIIADVGSQTVVTKTFEVSIQDGALTLNLDAEGSDGKNEPKLSAIEIVSLGSLNATPTAMADANPVSGEAPLVVDFDGSASDDDMGIVSYLWDFQDGTTSTSINPQHTFAPGTYEVSLTVTDGEGATDVDTVTITADEPIVNDFALRINAGGPEVVHNGETFAADSNFTGGKAYINNSAAVPPLYKTERSALPPSFSYNLPVENGNYQVVLHFAEIYWGATGGGAGGIGKRIFDVALEGNTILNDYDINADIGPQTVTRKTFDVTVTDGILNLVFDAAGSDGVDQPKVSAIEILGEDVAADNSQEPIVDAGDDVEVILPNSGFTLSGAGSDPDGGAVTYQWTQIDGPDTALLTDANTATVNVEVLVAGAYDFQLTVTDDEGTTVTDEVTVTAIQGNLDELWLEAECAEIGTGWNTVNDGSASGGQYMVPPPGFNQSTSSIGDAILTFNFSVTEGSYKVFGLVRTPSGTEDSFWVRVNGGPWVRWNSIPPSNSFAWHRIHFNEQLSQPRSFEFVEGINQIEIGHRESGVAIDKLYITQGDDLPSGIGGASSNCGAPQQALDDAAAAENFGNANKTVPGDFSAPIANDVSMFPNAAAISTQITMSNPEADIAKIYVYDVAGRLIRSHEGLELKSGAGAYILQVSNLDSGVYLLRITATDGNVFDEKLVVRH